MKDTQRISESEWEIMKIIWDKAPISSEEVINALSSKKDWSPRTIKSFLNRLMKKEVLGYTLTGRSYLYYPLLTKEEAISLESDAFLNRIYDGSLEMLFKYYLNYEKLSATQIDRLQKIMQKKKEEENMWLL